MKTLELGNYGVQEMNVVEVFMINGGVNGNENPGAFSLNEKYGSKAVRAIGKSLKDGWDFIRGTFEGFFS